MFCEVGRVELRLLKQYYWTPLYRSRIKKTFMVILISDNENAFNSLYVE